MNCATYDLLRDVSRETEVRLDIYARLLRQWNPKINLVSPTTLDDLQTRHFLDSAQVFHLLPDSAHHVADFGTGGGFPGLVLAILGQEKMPQLKITLVESDKRKAAFLKTVQRETDLKTTVLSNRIEDLDPLFADVITARALAPLNKVMQLCRPHLGDNSRCLFLKGKNWKKEAEEARRRWNFDATVHTSITDPSAVILEIPTYAHV